MFSLLTEFLRLQFPYLFLIMLGLLLILLVLYLPGGLASLWPLRWRWSPARRAPGTGQKRMRRG